MSVTQMYIVYYNTGRYGAAAVSYVFSTIMPSLVDSSSDDEVDFLRHYESSQQQQQRQQLLLCLKVSVLKLRS